MALALCVLFLGAVARFYHPGLGFTALIGFPEGHDYEAPALQAVPHYVHPAWASYDGQFYAQRALDPLVRDPLVDRAMDLAPFRARRILFSWTAYLAGLGRPAWILEAYALQNVAAWLLLALLLARWMAPRTLRGLALWTACLFSHGLLWSVRFALLDGPSLLLTAVAVALVEREFHLVSALVVGLNGLARETNVLGLLAQPRPRSWRGWQRVAVAVALAALPLLVWEDYLRSIYRSTIFAAAEAQISLPGGGLLLVLQRLIPAVFASGLRSPAGLQVLIVVPLVVQSAYVASHPRPDAAWWRIAAGYVLLMLVMGPALWEPSTGAITRVLLPLTVGFNVMLTRENRASRFWVWFAFGNLHLLPAAGVMPLVASL